MSFVGATLKWLWTGGQPMPPPCFPQVALIRVSAANCSGEVRWRRTVSRRPAREILPDPVRWRTPPGGRPIAVRDDGALTRAVDRDVCERGDVGASWAHLYLVLWAVDTPCAFPVLDATDAGQASVPEDRARLALLPNTHSASTEARPSGRGDGVRAPASGRGESNSTLAAPPRLTENAALVSRHHRARDARTSVGAQAYPSLGIGMGRRP